MPTTTRSGFVLTACLAVLPAASQAQAAADIVPRDAEGHVDLSGTWDNGNGVAFIEPRREGDSICLRNCGGAAVAPPPAQPDRAPRQPSRPSYRPEFAAKVADLTARQVKEDPTLRCISPGVPRIGLPDKIVQRRGEVVFLYDDFSGNYFRIVPTDGRPHRTDTEPTHLGDAVGRWEGDTLVVETVHFNDETWLTDDGAFHSTNLRVVERLSRTADTLHWSATVYDPEVLTEPWVVEPRTAELTDLELIEVPRCVDRDLEHIVDGSYHTNPR
jgi:hypothetical protein